MAEERPADPHASLNTPVSEIEADAELERLGHHEPVVDVTGMGRPQSSDTRASRTTPRICTHWLSSMPVLSS